MWLYVLKTKVNKTITVTALDAFVLNTYICKDNSFKKHTMKFCCYVLIIVPLRKIRNLKHLQLYRVVLLNSLACDCLNFPIHM